jgi:hypothetical protein
MINLPAAARVGTAVIAFLKIAVRYPGTSPPRGP